MEIWLVVVQGKQKGKFLRFPQGEFLFGRGPECHVRPDSASVSRQHCLLQVDQEGALVRDLGSTNGTLINGVRVRDAARLHPNDKIQLGPLVLQFHATAPAVAEPWENHAADTKGTDDYVLPSN